jgi:hypothetical protein
MAQKPENYPRIPHQFAGAVECGLGVRIEHKTQ